MSEERAVIEPMPTIPDPLIDEVLNDPDGYMERVYKQRRQEARAWVEAEMAEAEQRYRERTLGYRIMRMLRSLGTSERTAA